MHSCRKPTSGLHENEPTKTSTFAASSPILPAALSRGLAKGWLEMSILRQSKESSSSSQEVSQSVRRRFRGQPGHVVFCLPQSPARWQLLLKGKSQLLPAPTGKDKEGSAGLGRHDVGTFDVRRRDFQNSGEGSIKCIR